jgi:hypothetical protein
MVRRSTDLKLVMCNRWLIMDIAAMPGWGEQKLEVEAGEKE